MPDPSEFLSLCQAAKIMPGRPSIVSLWRWSTVGVRGAKLETWYCGGRRFTTKNAIAAFIQDCGQAAGNSPGPAPQPATQRQKSVEAAANRLRQAGI